MTSSLIYFLVLDLDNGRSIIAITATIIIIATITMNNWSLPTVCGAILSR
ncbi:MAG: hypothetical protein RXN78_03595 [Vulcanisaeta sp.]